MHPHPGRGPLSPRASGRRSSAGSAPSSARPGRTRSSCPTAWAKPASPPSRTARCRRSRWPYESSRWRSRRGRTEAATPSCHDPSRSACRAWWSGCSDPSTRLRLLVPLQASLAPDVREGDEQDAHEHEHLDEAEPLELAEEHCPRVEEDGLDVEDDEQHRRQVEADRQAADGGRVRDDARLVRRHLAPVGLGRAEHEAQGRDRSHKPKNDQDEDQNWDVALEQVSGTASGREGGFRGTGLILCRPSQITVEAGLTSRGRQASPVEPPPLHTMPGGVWNYTFCDGRSESGLDPHPIFLSGCPYGDVRWSRRGKGSRGSGSSDCTPSRWLSRRGPCRSCPPTRSGKSP